MSPAAAATLFLAGAFVLGVGVPWVFMRLLAPTLAESPLAARTNYAGRQVFLGLGVVWLIWAGCAIVAGSVVGALAPAPDVPFAAGVLVLAGPLALVAFSLGMVDDALGSGDDRGFRGHFRALARGRMTTGMLKLIGISLAALVCCAVLADVAPWGRSAVVPAGGVLSVLMAAAAVALTSNLVNLVDLRPTRALKVYVLLVLVGAPIAGSLTLVPGAPPTTASLEQAALSTGVLLLFALGPVVAVWSYDASGRGMLGDAGANPMGAVAGLLIVAGLPGWALATYLVAVLLLNAASERVSFSAVIERNAALGFFDRLGRREAAPNPDARRDEEGQTDPARGGSEG